MNTELPQRLQQAMRDAGFLDPRSGNPSLNQWSKAAGVHTSTISRFISGGTSRSDGVRKLADSLGVSVDDLHSMTQRPGKSPWSPPRGTEDLTVRQRHALNELILAFLEDGSSREEGDGDGKATPHTDAGGTPVTGEDDGLGAFGGRARGDLDHESINDGAGDNVRQLRGPKPEASAAQHEGDEASVDEIMRHAAYEPSEPDNPDPEDR